jgi:hypothetical protein
MGIAQPNLGVLFNVSFIVLGVVIATFGEIKFVLTGFLFQCGGIIFEATRLVLVQKLLNGEEYKMDPLVSLYYFAPVCTVMNAIIALFLEVPHISINEVYGVGAPILIANALVAFLLNVSAVFLVSTLPLFPSPTSKLTNSDRPNLISCADPMRRPQRCPTSSSLYDALAHPCVQPAILRLRHFPHGPYLLQNRP